jgi:serine/threonine protein kinase
VHGDLRGVSVVFLFSSLGADKALQSNILINGKWQACLTDFGLTVFNDATAPTFTSRREGSVRWMAPELHVPERFGLDRFRLTFETDIYAFGCVCLEVSLPTFPPVF